MSPDDEPAEVEEANARFYRAFEALDLGEMERVWAHVVADRDRAMPSS